MSPQDQAQDVRVFERVGSEQPLRLWACVDSTQEPVDAVIELAQVPVFMPGQSSFEAVPKPRRHLPPTWRRRCARRLEDQRSRDLLGYGYRKCNITFDNTKVHSETICANEARVRLVGNPYGEI